MDLIAKKKVFFEGLFYVGDIFISGHGPGLGR
jgi:hypothetical protein